MMEQLLTAYRYNALESYHWYKAGKWKDMKGVGPKTARKWARADLESYRYMKRLLACKSFEEEREVLYNFKWKWNK